MAIFGVGKGYCGGSGIAVHFRKAVFLLEGNVPFSGACSGLVVCVYIRFFGNGGWRFRPYGGSLLEERQK